MAKRKSYDDKFRASAVVMLEAAGYPNEKGALQKVANNLGVPARTLSRWFNGEQNPPPDQVVSIKKRDLADRLEDIAHLLLDHVESPDTIDDMSGQQAMTSFGIAVDKMRILQGLPTEIIGYLPLFTVLVEKLGEIGQSPSDVFNRMIARIDQEHNAND